MKLNEARKHSGRNEGIKEKMEKKGRQKEEKKEGQICYFKIQ